ncbi:hypothetical protein T4E_3055 [Trichinella pseudospiralis]|uniref:Uncharacterized protein n=1 Tax=Trichinella pseudospiralis TaxID=6337 RepID=A0A0V0XVJ6_TRIPS|nr:hypothetical protein T4E_3055 [Trichinella pseudospiralis]
MSIPCTFETSRRISIPQINYPGGKYCAVKCQRRSPKAYANFYLPSGYAPGNASGIFFENFEFFKILAAGVAPGYASGQKKICISPPAMPGALPEAIFQKLLKFPNF